MSQTRHRIGVVLLVLPLLLAWSAPYLGQHLPGYLERPWVYAIAGDALLLVAFFVLGGDFWGRLRALCLWRPANPEPAVTAGERSAG